MAPPKSEPRDRFLTHVRQAAGCWEWTAGRTPEGYGKFWLNGRTIGAHRAAWLLFVGPIPEGICVMHTCDNPPCVRWTDHLELGSYAMNRVDMIGKARWKAPNPKRPRGDDHWRRQKPWLVPRGEQLKQSKITELQAKDIIRRVSAGEIMERLAPEFGITPEGVSAVVRGKTWKHLQRPG